MPRPRRRLAPSWPLLLLVGLLPAAAPAQDATIRVRADRPGPAVTPHLTGACIEDVNHEIYGGISSQMVFGESFGEPPVAAVAGFVAHGGAWAVDGDVARVAAGDGPKLLAEAAPVLDGEVAVQVRFDDARPGLAGLIVRVDGAGVGADHFRGYEVSLDPSRQLLVFGRHRQNWEPLREAPCAVPVGRWVDLIVRLKGPAVEVSVDGRQVLRFEDRDHALGAGAVGLRTWRKDASFRWLRVHDGPRDEAIPIAVADPAGAGGTSGMWRVVRRGSAAGALALEADRPFVGAQSQRITLLAGDGAIGAENRGLNRQGMGFVAAKPYEGALWLRADRPTEVRVAAETGDGSRTLAEATITATSPEWTRYEFALTPSDADAAGRLAITLRQPGSVVVGFASLQPGPWGRYKGLPVRRDVAEALVESGVTVMRLGGLMANADGYRWKNMIGPRDRRQPYRGYWYPHSSNGWGIVEFLDLCEAAGFLPIVDLNLDESPQDLADFLEYANGPADSPWGRRRAEAGHPAPYRLKYVELGNEEAVDATYWRKFRPLAEAAWARDPGVILIVGDFEYRRPIVDPTNFEGAPRIRSLAAHKEILDLAKARGRSVWFDVHIWNHSPKDAPGRIAALQTFDAALGKLSPGADFRVCVLEENATNHDVRRAVAHGETVNGLMRLGDRVPVVCAANALQPDGQNDNGWDQGLVFLDPAGAWLQPPAYVTQMIRRYYLPRVVEAAATGEDGDLDVVATRAEDGSALVLQVANTGTRARPARIALDGFAPKRPVAAVEQLAGPWDAANTADEPTRVAARRSEWRHEIDRGVVRTTFPPRSFTVLRFE